MKLEGGARFLGFDPNLHLLPYFLFEQGKFLQVTMRSLVFAACIHVHDKFHFHLNKLNSYFSLIFMYIYVAEEITKENKLDFYCKSF